MTMAKLDATRDFPSPDSVDVTAIVRALAPSGPSWMVARSERNISATAEVGWR
jgi:hypothetical protein